MSTPNASPTPDRPGCDTPVQLPPVLPPSPCCCDSDPITGLKQLFVDYFQGRGMAAGRDPATRPVFLRLHGVAHGRLVIDPDLPEALKVGVFAQAPEYPVWVRFSADVQPGVPDLKGTTGIAIKLFGVTGPKLLAPDEAATTHDFILQNHDVFFVDTAKDMCEFTCQSLHGNSDDYLKAHPVTQQVLNEMEKVVDSALTTPYWSVLPSCFGEGRFVKYKLEPLSAPAAEAQPDFNDPFYLRADLQARLGKGPARFRFLVQFQTDEHDMPLDAATVRWSETASPPVQLGILELPQQDLGERGQATYGENLAYNPWHALPEHRPVGSIAEARKVVYRASAANRRNVNGVPLAEPAVPRPAQYAPGVDYPAARDTRIVRAAIHPAIGIARVGNSEHDFYLGPQVTEPAPQPLGFYRDATGALKREAAQFRLYGYNAAGEVVRELTSDWADIAWTVHLANRKAAWYQWQIAMDIPEAAETVLPRRNPKVTARDSLVIDAGRQRIAGPNAQPLSCSGQFTGVPVKLGELRTDAHGRLLVLGGHGVSASPAGTPIFIPSDSNSFINADGWYDDTCDGTVEASVNIEGRDIPVEAAWVVTAPPNYAPQLKAERTLYDLLYDLYVEAGWLQAPATVSFADDVYPILQRLTGLQWVNQGFATLFGHNGRYDFENPALLAQLSALPPAGQYDPNAELRRQVFNSFRPPNPADGNQLPWPWLYGDAMTVPAGESPRQNASVSQTQYRILQRWAEGDFAADWDPQRTPPTDIDRVPLADQPAMLDRAALEFCLADAFHPGCELTWPMRHLTLYSKPFRIRMRAPDTPEPDYGPTLDQAAALAAQGPLYAQGPGDLNRWMGLPWQADTAWCRAGYDTAYDPFAPTFWPARVPNHVLAAHDYAVVVDPSQPLARRIEAFSNRTDWNKPLHGNTAGQMEQMVRIFGSMGLLEVRPGVASSPDFPATMMVASYGPDVAPADAASLSDAARAASALKAASAEGLPKAHPKARPLPQGANFDSHDEARSAPLPVRRGKRHGG
ncbi:LodA/GoxA family CTQ-dependent oxidase [Chitiniphilus purpureus]|uniref:LodA/GoxA family CTQ-dependent oxidase n=1 Tax=Chitiniphilus purpureus TaxID=2981137 RepID=A0ABY6DKH6_9NEIS|nr:LodA/GoxA family CTQ-dependent oxidase [Chitiniphilus sp. CD1]UXY14854.1 LodA/GoxA family CTQ-dependent oxidase [Chitiniphilus sp. CD1]